jgi:hypothetical protein
MAIGRGHGRRDATVLYGVSLLRAAVVERNAIHCEQIMWVGREQLHAHMVRVKDHREADTGQAAK